MGFKKYLLIIAPLKNISTHCVFSCWHCSLSSACWWWRRPYDGISKLFNGLIILTPWDLISWCQDSVLSDTIKKLSLIQFSEMVYYLALYTAEKLPRIGKCQQLQIDLPLLLRWFENSFRRRYKLDLPQIYQAKAVLMQAWYHAAFLIDCCCPAYSTIQMMNLRFW